MNLYLFATIFSCLLAIVFGYLLFHRNQNKEGFFAFLFIVFSAIWIIFYYIFFSGIEDPTLLMFISRVGYWSGLPCVISFLFFVKYFKEKSQTIFTPTVVTIVGFYVISMIVYCYTDLIIAGIVYENIGEIYREVPGKLYDFTYLVYGGFLISVISFSYKRLRLLTNLERKRLLNIVIATFSLVISLVLLQLVLPLFGIWVFERQIIIIYLVYIIYIYQTLQRYYFSSIFYGIGKLISIIVSFVITAAVINIIKNIPTQSGNFQNYWNISDSYDLINSVLSIIIFTTSYRFFGKVFLGLSGAYRLEIKLKKIQKEISKITSFEELNKKIQKEIEYMFKAKVSYVRFFEEGKESELYSYFNNQGGEKVFINDIVFIEDNTDNLSLGKLKHELDPELFIFFPLHNSSNIVIGFLGLGGKPFGDFYTKEEITVLQSFAFFLEIHSRYIRTYDKMTDLSKNLDKKVDEKTIEYNDLINKQKEFISMISHEVRSPIGSTIFQIDSLIEEFDQKEMSPQEIKKRLRSLCDQLVHIGELLKKLFSIQYFETRNVTLLKEKIDIGNLLEKEFSIYSRMYEDTTFINKIDQNIGFVNIDKIHFHQVLTNLLENAIKFADPENPSILIQSRKSDTSFSITIEDNGSGFGDMNPSMIFEKYTKGNHEKLGLGMGLYLCNRIVSMHDGSLTASRGVVLSGASFTIVLPL